MRLSEMFELVSLVRPSTLYDGVHIDLRYLVQGPTFQLSLNDKTCQPVLRRR